MKGYFIGGSPCSGKSTVAQAIAERHGFIYFKADDKLEEYTTVGAKLGFPICSKQRNMTAEQIWMRSPAVQAAEERAFYHEIFPLVMLDIKKLSTPFIAEGVAFLPELMKAYGVPFENYIFITPTREFQIEHYRTREWVPFLLQGCLNPKKAFENWMERDALFAEAVRHRCVEAEYFALLTDGAESVEKMTETVACHFKLI